MEGILETIQNLQDYDSEVDASITNEADNFPTYQDKEFSEPSQDLYSEEAQVKG
jgi:hypothetical protein